MSLRTSILGAVGLVLASLGHSQTLPVKWEEMTAPEFVAGIHKGQGTCLLPIGIIEKHGPHLPLGADLIQIDYIAEHAAAQEYAVVFPAYYFGNQFEAPQEPGELVYSARLQIDLLDETTREMARNGCKKILIVNGHGGNPAMLRFFAQSQLASPRDFVVYVWEEERRIRDLPGRPMKSKTDHHAGESETSQVLVARPDLVHIERAKSESYEDQHRVELPPGIYTPTWWYSHFPNQYGGDGSLASKELGEFDTKAMVSDVAGAIRAVKADQVSAKLQEEIWKKMAHPLEVEH